VGAIRCGCAAVALSFGAPAAAAEIDLLSPDTLQATGIVRFVATSGERSWVDGGFGKLGSNGGGGDLRVRPQLSEANLIWTPQLGWALSATVVGTFQGGDRTEAGISQAFLSYRPMRSEKFSLSARAGLMWPPVSLEHDGADWHVKDTATASAINSWISEEVRPAAVEATIGADLGNQKLTATAAIFAANDTSGTLLAFRGWALHDRRTLAFNRQPLPPLPDELEEYQAAFTHPLIDLGRGFARRPGYYAKLAWSTPLPVRIELFRYDNRAAPEISNSDLEWGWRTQFYDAGLAVKFGGSTELKMQALSGRTRMGMVQDGRHWIDMRFRSAFALLTHPFGPIGVAARIEGFDTRNRGSLLDEEYNETGWAGTLAAKRDWGRFTTVIELLHVSSRRDQLQELGLAPRQRQTQLQADLRLRW
jgi:hypothetical protein